MKSALTVAAALFLFAGQSTAHALALAIENQSEWEIHELYFSPTSEKNWGPDQLGEMVINPGETFTLKKIDKGNYDVRIVDEDGDDCVIPQVNFNASEHFELTDKILLGCQQATAEQAEE